MMRLEESEAAHAASLLALASVLADNAHRLDVVTRNDIVDMLVDLGFDDSDEPGSMLDRLAVRT